MALQHVPGSWQAYAGNGNACLPCGTVLTQLLQPRGPPEYKPPSHARPCANLLHTALEAEATEDQLRHLKRLSVKRDKN